MVQSSAFVEWLRLWCYTDGDEVHVYEIDLEFFEPESDGHDGGNP